jgi:hypothetical protein
VDGLKGYLRWASLEPLRLMVAGTVWLVYVGEMLANGQGEKTIDETVFYIGDFEDF